MGISNKLGVFFVGVNVLLPVLAHALIIEPIKIDSSQGEPLYAEIPFHNANSQSPLQVSVAQPFELGIPEAVDPTKFAHYNFYVRQNNQGNGVIVITSNRPMNENNLNLVLKINDSGQVHIQQLRNKLPSRIERLQSSLQEKTLQPRMVVDEKALELNLPTTSNNETSGQALVVQQTPPPLLNNNVTSVNASANTPTTPAPPAIVVTPMQASPTTTESKNLSISVTRRLATDPVPSINVGLQSQIAKTIPETSIQDRTPPVTASPSEQVASAAAPAVSAPPAVTKAPTKAAEAKEQQHTVKANESLWAIANQIAKSQNVSINQVMKNIHEQNAHAFIDGNANRLKQGVILNIPTEYNMPVIAKAEPPVKPAQINKPTPNSAAAPQKQTQAHMSIVANDSKGAAQGANKAGQSTSAQQNELTVQLKQERSATLDLQNNVRQLDQQLKQKENRIALLNARLAELEQQLKLRQTEQSSNDASKTSSRSQSVVPAIIAGTLVAFAGLNSDLAVAILL